MSAPDLRPCPRCRRHVRLDEASCPFCSAALAPAEPPVLPSGRLTRAAVFAGAVLAGACAKGSSERSEPAAVKPDTHVGADASAPASRPPPDATVADAAAPPDASAPDAAVPKQKKKPKPPDEPVRVKPPDHPIPKPYGAPPARSRLV